MELTKGKLVLGTAIASAIIFVAASSKLFEILDAGEVMVIQYPWGGLAVMTEPGPYFQGFGNITKYARREQYSFSAPNAAGEIDKSIKIQFNDGGNANISGLVSWEMPLVPEKILKIHKEFRSQEGVDQQLVRPAISNAMFMSGPLMSSTESAGDRRSELLQLITDQAQNGIYKTERVQKKITDPITGTEKYVTAGEIVMEKGLPKREAESPLSTLGIKMFPATINQIKYDETVQRQINERQKQITEVQTAIAQAKKAEQQAITVAKQGEASAAEAKWKQEVLKAQAVTEAEQLRAVAELAVKTAELNKRANELEGQGEAAKRQAIMNADGGLEKKLVTYEKVNALWADAFKHHTGAMVPGVVVGQSGGTAASGISATTALVDLMTAKTARELGLDNSIRTGKEK